MIKKSWLQNYRINLLLFLIRYVNLILFHKFNYLLKNLSLIQYEYFVPFYLYLISEGEEIVRACDRQRNETVTLRKHVTKYKYMRKWMVEFLSKSQICGIKFARVNSIRMTKSINLI